MFAFGGLYEWTLVPAGLLAALALFLNRPTVFGRSLALDLALTSALAVVVLQAIPLPPFVWSILSPHAIDLKRALTVGIPDFAGWQALSISPPATWRSAAWIAVAIAVFWSARHLFEHGRLGSLLRPIGIAGLAVSSIAIVQRAATPLLMYGLWPAADASAKPFGPFVNRNHMAAWLIMAIPLTAGYAITRLRSRIASLPDQRLAMAQAIDATAVWQIGAILTMISTVFVSVSRSGVVGLLIGTAAGFTFASLKGVKVRFQWVAAVAVLLLASATYLANFDALADHFARALDRGTERTEIWRQTMPIVRDFAIAGTGQGTFSRAMLVYQQGDRSVLFNQAHDQYLQIVAEGGVLLTVPACCAVLIAAAGAMRRLKEDSTVIFWARAGAASALAAIAVQSVWETGLSMPANSVLFAICAALALHHPAADRQR
ncbi:MAG TPA: O-antigen ligase family protein [Vicinamibacterales bacterium]|nr:O-antigen ligase family protein [Vicinamibacterales bacterium]